MLNDQTKKILSPLKTASLTNQEKATIKAELVARLDLTATTESSFSIGYQKLAGYFVFAASVFALALASGAGLSQAAEASLPGDWLYPIKTKVAEPMTRALINDRHQQFDLETEILEKRFHEAETLIQEEELDEDRKEQIKIEIKKQTAKAAAVLKQEQTTIEPEDEKDGRDEVIETNKQAEDDKKEDDKAKKEREAEDNEAKRNEEDRKHKLERILEQHQETIEKLEFESDHEKQPEAKEKSVRNDEIGRHNDRERD